MGVHDVVHDVVHAEVFTRRCLPTKPINTPPHTHSARQRRMQQEKLRSTKTLGEADGYEEEEDLMAWVAKSRVLEDKAKAEARAKALELERSLAEQEEEQDGEDGDAGGVPLAAGMKVKGAVEEIMEGETLVMTLEDAPILDEKMQLNEGDDVLVNAAMVRWVILCFCVCLCVCVCVRVCVCRHLCVCVCADRLRCVIICCIVVYYAAFTHTNYINTHTNAQREQFQRDKARRAATKTGKPLFGEDGKKQALLDKYDEEGDEEAMEIDASGGVDVEKRKRQEEIKAKLAAAGAFVFGVVFVIIVFGVVCGVASLLPCGGGTLFVCTFFVVLCSHTHLLCFSLFSLIHTPYTHHTHTNTGTGSLQTAHVEQQAAAEFYTAEEAAALFKPKKKKKKKVLRKRDADNELDLDALEVWVFWVWVYVVFYSVCFCAVVMSCVMRVVM